MLQTYMPQLEAVFISFNSFNSCLYGGQVKALEE